MFCLRLKALHTQKIILGREKSSEKSCLGQHTLEGLTSHISG